MIISFQRNHCAFCGKKLCGRLDQMNSIGGLSDPKLNRFRSIDGKIHCCSREDCGLPENRNPNCPSDYCNAAEFLGGL
jgi:hypothetical protein